MITAGMLLQAITSGEWHRYDGAPYEYDSERGYTPFYATTGTTGEDAVNLRCEITTDRTPRPVDYQPVGDDRWYPTGYQAIMRIDKTRDITTDSDGWDFIPYQVTELHKVTS